MKYKNPRALEMAVKAAARASGTDTSKAIAGFYFDRFLCRVFSEDDPAFILKGGQSMLARTPAARSTRDIDLLSQSLDIEEAVEELKRIASIDLGDFMTYAFARVAKIKETDEYRSGYKVYFHSSLGLTRKSDISIDLVADQVTCEKAIKQSPASRLIVGDLQTYNYLLYPIENAIADKVCAIAELHDGRESSRVKDLVDLAVVFTTQEVDAKDMRRQVELEARLRKLAPISGFSIPASWISLRQGQYAKLARETSLPAELQKLEPATEFIANRLNTAIAGKEDGKRWNPVEQLWK